MSKVYKINELKGGALSSLGSLISSPLLFLTVLVAPIGFWVIRLNLSLNNKILIVGVYLILILILSLKEFEGRKIYQLILPFTRFMFQKKVKTDIKNLNFDIYQNSLVFTDRVVKVLSVEPVDVLLMSDQEKGIFKKQVYSFLNSIGNKNRMQVVYYARQAQNNDYTKHFDRLLSIKTDFQSEAVKDERNRRLTNYISELKQIIETNLIPKREFFLVLSVKLTNNGKQELAEALTELNNYKDKIAGLLYQAGIETATLENENLKQFLQTNLRNI